MLSRTLVVAGCAMMLGSLAGCKANISQGFAVQTSYRFLPMAGGTMLGPEMNMPEVLISGEGHRDQHTNQGHLDNYAGVTDILGGYFVDDAILPACWDHHTRWPSSAAILTLPALAV